MPESLKVQGREVYAGDSTWRRPGNQYGDVQPPGKVHAQILKQAWARYLLALLFSACAAVVAWLVNWHGDPANLIMIYLLAVVCAAIWLGRGPAALCSCVSVASFDFVFVPPVLQFTPTDGRYFFSLTVMLIISLVISELAARARQRAQLAQERVKTTEAQFFLSRDLSMSRSVDELPSVAALHLDEVFHCRVAVFLKDKDAPTLQLIQTASAVKLRDNELASAQEAFSLKQPVMPRPSDNKTSTGLYLPLIGMKRTVGVIGLFDQVEAIAQDPVQMNLLQSFANNIAVAVERAMLSEESDKAKNSAEQERLRNALLSSVSHDLRTPLSSITGAASSILASLDAMSISTVRELIQSIYDESERLNRLVGNLLDMTRLQAGIISIKKDWNSLEEVVGAAITRTEGRLRNHKIVTSLPADLPLIKMEPTLIQQLFINLMENAAKFSEPGNEIHISAMTTEKVLKVEVFNSGSQLAPDEQSKIFEKFYRGRQTSSGNGGGVGLGLAICRAIMQAHNGTILAENISGKGVNFLIILPLEPDSPRLDMEMES